MARQSFETEWLANDENLTLRSLRTMDAVHRAQYKFQCQPDLRRSGRHRLQRSTPSAPTTIRCSCSTSSATSNGARCDPGNVHSADAWKKALEPVVARYREHDLRPRPALAWAAAVGCMCLDDEGKVQIDGSHGVLDIGRGVSAGVMIGRHLGLHAHRREMLAGTLVGRRWPSSESGTMLAFGPFHGFIRGKSDQLRWIKVSRHRKLQR